MNDLKFAFRRLLKNPGFTTVAVITLALAVSVGSASAQTDASRAGSLPSARAVLDRYIEAIGGREQLLRLKFAHLTGRFDSVELGYGGPLEVWTAAPSKRLAQIDLEGYGQVLQGFDGKSGWILEPQQDMRFLDGADLDRLREDADFRAQLHESAAFSRLETVGQVLWDERPCYELRLTTKSGRECGKFFDVETGLLLGMKTREAVNETTIYRDYRTFAGLRIPTVELKSSGGLLRQTIRICSADFARIENRLFDYRRHEPRLDRKLFPEPHKNSAEQADAADEIVLQGMARVGIPGLALAVVRRGELVKAEGYGLADIEAKQLVTPTTVFQLCSVTKSFTALAVTLLAQDGKLNLDDPIQRRVSDLPKAADGITIRQLLSHTAGLSREPYTWNSLASYDEGAVLEAIFRVSFGRQPGDQFAYSNGGYHLLGILIHRVTGEPWHEWMAVRMFSPLGLKQTGPLELAETLPERAVGYVLSPKGGWERGHRDRPVIVGTAGGLMSSVLDLAKFDTALSRGSILSPAALKQLWEPARLNSGETVGYGLGWYLNQHRGHRVVEHTGGNIEGIRTIIARFVDDQLTIILLCNWSKADVQALSRRIADLYLDAPSAVSPKTNSPRKP